MNFLFCLMADRLQFSSECCVFSRVANKWIDLSLNLGNFFSFQINPIGSHHLASVNTDENSFFPLFTFHVFGCFYSNWQNVISYLSFSSTSKNVIQSYITVEIVLSISFQNWASKKFFFIMFHTAWSMLHCFMKQWRYE